MNNYDKFKNECNRNINIQNHDTKFINIASDFLVRSFKHNYPYNFEFLGRPIIQYPQDIVMIQEIIWKVKPNLIIETGIAHGGSLILSASMMALLDISQNKNPLESERLVLGIDIDIRDHNKKEILNHPLCKNIKMIEGSSIATEIVDQVSKISREYNNVLVILDSNHTHEHVLSELNVYAKLINVDSYCIVLDTIIEDLPDDTFPNRPWGVGNNPKTAVYEFLKSNKNFEIDTYYQRKNLITVACDGLLKKIK